MGKYIIEVGDAYAEYICGKGDMLCLPVRINEFEDNWLNTNIPLTPYTEPDMEKVREEAYERGREDAIDAISSKEQSIADKAYQSGLSDAWEAARKLVLDSNHGGLTNYDIEEIFGVDEEQAIINYSASEAIEKIRQYEQEQEEEQIQVGDEVYVEKLQGKAVVMQTGKIMCCAFQNGDTFTPHMKDCKKTGRHFPEIAEVLRKMKEES